jgi:hypothetical protein
MEDISDKLRLFLTQHWNSWSPEKILSHIKVVVPEINKGLTYVYLPEHKTNSAYEGTFTEDVWEQRADENSSRKRK